MGTLLLHRHASAGARFDDPGRDRSRPLDRGGRADARGLPIALASFSISGVVSSPLRRCVESVRPIAGALGLELVRCEALGPDAPVEDTLVLLSTTPDDTLVCTHREVIERLFAGKIDCEKGGTWVVDIGPSHRLAIEYVPPASAARRMYGHAVLVRGAR